MNKNIIDKFNTDFGENVLFPTYDYTEGRLADDIFQKIKNEKYIKEILEGAYMKYRHRGDTYFHELIANDKTKYALRLLKFIDKIAEENGKRDKLDELVPFTEFENKDEANRLDYSGNIKKNFLMLAIAKKYDSSIPEKMQEDNLSDSEKIKSLERSIQSRANMLEMIVSKIKKEDLEKLKKQFSIYDASDKKEIEKIKTSGFSTAKCNHKDKYQKDDAELIHWLIDKAPMECLQQKDSEGYNLVDYALMKMDFEILQHLLQKEPKLFEDSKLYKDVLSGKFSYEDAAQKVKARYCATIAIADKAEWNNKKGEIRKFLQEHSKAKPVNNKKIEKKEKEKSNGIF